MQNQNLIVGFLGGGALAESVIRGISNNLTPAQNIFVSEQSAERRAFLEKNLGVHVSNCVDFADKINALILAVKPKDAATALAELQTNLTPNVLVMSVVAGLKLQSLENYLPNLRIIRVMPNVNVAVSEGMIALAAGSNASNADLDTAKNFWRAVGRTVQVDEKLMDAVTGLSGSGPAFAFLAIDALADGGVAAGLPRDVSILLAAQTLLGSAKLVLESGSHPDVLRDRVTSPAGTTIEGVRVLERNGFRSALLEAVIAAAEKSKIL